MSLPQTISELWEPTSPISITRHDIQEIREEASRCWLALQVQVIEAKQIPWRSNEDIIGAATQLLSLLLDRPSRKIIRLVHAFSGILNIEPMGTVQYALSIWRANTAHFSEDAHYIEGDQELSAIGTNAILLANLDWRPGQEVRPWLRGALMVVNSTSAALGAALMVLQYQRSAEATFGELELANFHKKNSEGLQMFLRTALDTIRKSQVDRGVNAGQELGLTLGVDTQLSKDLCLWTLHEEDSKKFSPAPLLHPARKVLGSPWKKLCYCHGVENEFAQRSVPLPLRAGTMEFRVPDTLNIIHLGTRSSYIRLGIKYRQLNRGTWTRSAKGTMALFKYLARNTGLPYSNAFHATATPTQEMEIPFHNYDMTRQPTTDTKGYLSFPFMTSIVREFDTHEGGQDVAEENEVTVGYTHYLVNALSAFQ